tara:strand:- start:5128 stop:6141 length:1014 start_codon:yes stop_codon:yes gene_type:complete
MPNAMSSILRASTRNPDEKLNILTFPTHERYETGLAKSGHSFYAYRAEGIKDWNETYAPLPENYTLLNPNMGNAQLPTHIDFDLVLSQNKFGQFQKAQELATLLHLPLISLEHTLPVPEWNEDIMNAVQNMRGDINVFISAFSIDEWGWQDKQDTAVITHGIDTDLFCTTDKDRNQEILSVVNDWINRDWCCGFNIWQRVIDGLPYKVVGDTPGLSEPAASTEELVATYQNSRIFLNTSTISPVPTALMEAMSCGCAVVSTDTCMIPEVIEHGVNGFITNDENQMKQHLVDLLNNEDMCKEIGENARKTIVKNYSMDTFISNWDKAFRIAANIPFRG